jgi:Sugar (and other) transporter
MIMPSGPATVVEPVLEQRSSGRSATSGLAETRRTVLDMNRYQWTVLFAAWLGWGFDIFDGLLFNYVAPNCVPTLLGLPIGSPEANQVVPFVTGVLTSLLLIGWAAGGILFGRVADRIGRARTLLLTMALYSLGTAACSLAPTIWVLGLFRLIASLGIGGEWAAGAAMVAEVAPEERRVEAGALLSTAGPLGLFLATFVNFQISHNLVAVSPGASMALRLPDGADPLRRGLHRPVVRRGTRTVDAAGEDGAGAGILRALCRRRAQNDVERLRDGRDCTRYVVEHQRLHPGHLEWSRERGARQCRGMEEGSNQQLQPRRPDRGAAHRPGIEDPRAQADVRDLLRSERCGDRRDIWLGRRPGDPAAHVLRQRPLGLRRVR